MSFFWASARVFCLSSLMVASYSIIRFGVTVTRSFLSLCTCVCARLSVPVSMRFPARKTQMNRKNPSMFARFCVPAAFFPFRHPRRVHACECEKRRSFHLGIPSTSSSSASLCFSFPRLPLSLSLSPHHRFFSSASARYFQICHILIAINLAIE